MDGRPRGPHPSQRPCTRPWEWGATPHGWLLLAAPELMACSPSTLAPCPGIRNAASLQCSACPGCPASAVWSPPLPHTVTSLPQFQFFARSAFDFLPFALFSALLHPIQTFFSSIVGRHSTGLWSALERTKGPRRFLPFFDSFPSCPPTTPLLLPLRCCACDLRRRRRQSSSPSTHSTTY